MTEPHPTPPPSRGPSAWLANLRADRALRRTLALALGIAVASTLGLLAMWPHLGGAGGPHRLPWWVFALAFAGAEIAVFHVELRREAHTFTLAEVPLVIGLFFAAPLHLIAGRMLAEVVILGFKERLPGRKLALNLAAFLGECAVALAVFHLIPGTRAIDQPLSWVVALGAIVAADALSIIAVSMAIRWHGAPDDLAHLAATNSVTVVTNTSLALAAALLITTNRAAVVLLSTMCALIVLAYRGYTSLSQRYTNLQLLYDFTRLVNGVQRPDVVLEGMLDKARELLRAEDAGIYLLGEGDAPASELWLVGDDPAIETARLGDAMARQLLGGPGTLVLANDCKDPGGRAVLDALGTPDAVVARLNGSSGVMGLLVVARRQGSVATFENQDGRVFESLANHASVALDNGRLIDRLHDQALQREYESLHDALTGLANRTLFTRTLEAALTAAKASGGSLAVGVMDLDHFKEVNDTLGHYCGDLLLQEVAARVTMAVPAGVVVARLGGDEFALLVPDLEDRSALVELGDAIQESCHAPFRFEGLGLDIDASIGFAVYPEHATDAVTLLQRADVAMYTAKSSVRSGIEVYDASSDTHDPRRLILAGDLRLAIDSDDLTLHFQPQARLSDGEIVGTEALVRWYHPELGPILPEEFIPLVERTGLIQPFTDWVLRSAIEQLAAWQAKGLDVSVSVNLSMRNLLDADLPARVRSLLFLHRVDPANVTLEVTESSIMSEPAKVVKVLEELAALGCRLSIDDFGTGYSSLAYIQRLPVHEIKIDKSFVFPLTTDRGAAAIVTSVIDLARNLGLVVMAEGVEDRRCWDRLAELGCDLAQGYYLSRAIPAKELEEWLTDRSRLRARAS